MSLLGGQGQGKQSIVYKIFKPVREVTPADVLTGLQQVLSGVASPEHMPLAQLAQPAMGQ